MSWRTGGLGVYFETRYVMSFGAELWIALYGFVRILKQINVGNGREG